MGRLKQRLELARKALVTLDELVGISKPTPIERDAAIQRFEYSFEAVWKTARRYLYDIEGVEVASPKAVIRASFAAGLLDEQATRLALEMVDDRNLTSHTYNEGLAELIFSRLNKYTRLMNSWIASMAGKEFE